MARKQPDGMRGGHIGRLKRHAWSSGHAGAMAGPEPRRAAPPLVRQPDDPNVEPEPDRDGRGLGP